MFRAEGLGFRGLGFRVFGLGGVFWVHDLGSWLPKTGVVLKLLQLTGSRRKCKDSKRAMAFRLTLGFRVL